MAEQQLAVEQENTGQQLDDQAISWQYVVLAIGIAILIMIMGTVQVDTERPMAPVVVEPFTAPQALADLQLNSTFTEPTLGISFDYPDSWDVQAIPPNVIIASNFAQATQRPSTASGEARLVLNIFTLEELIASGVALDPDMSAFDMMMALINPEAQATLDMSATTIAGLDGARGYVSENGYDQVLFLAQLDDATLLLGIYDAPTDEWEAADDFFGEMLDTITFTAAESSAEAESE